MTLLVLVFSCLSWGANSVADSGKVTKDSSSRAASFEEMQSSTSHQYLEAEQRLVEFLRKRISWDRDRDFDKVVGQYLDDQNHIQFYQRREMHSKDMIVGWMEAIVSHYKNNPQIRTQSFDNFLRIKVVGEMGFVVSRVTISWFVDGKKYTDHIRSSEVFQYVGAEWKSVHLHRSMQYDRNKRPKEDTRIGFQDLIND